MKNVNLALSLFALIFGISCISKSPTIEQQPAHSISTQAKTTPTTIMLDKKYFIVNYDLRRKQALYVRYHLRSEDLRKPSTKREDRFHADPELIKLGLPAVGPRDYEYSGFDRGHLAPSGDFEWSDEANDLTFTMANMSPQRPQLNRVVLRHLEGVIRSWACEEGDLLIITGPLFGVQTENLASGVAIPSGFFKVVLDMTPPLKAVGFLLEQTDSKSQIYKNRVKTVREIETITGINFFEDLPRADAESIETKANINKWKGSKCKGISKSSN